MKVEFKWVGLVRVVKDFGLRKRRAWDLRPVWPRVDRSVRRMYDKVWRSSGAYINKRWRRLSPATLAIRRGRGRYKHGLSRILWERGDLRASLVREHTRYTVRRMYRQKYFRGTKHPAARMQQFGWTQHTIFGSPRRRARRVPARPFVPEPKNVPRRLSASWRTMVSEYVHRGRVR
jgi:hypothetical protein